MTKTQLIILAVIAIFAIGFFVMRDQAPSTLDPAGSQTINNGNNNGSNGAAQETAAENTVVYTDDGFSPAELTVATGTEVTFVNQSNNPMWVGSDSHPAHNDYPDFDQLEGGDQYSYTFTEAGSYNYHNHLVPSDGGVVIVE